MALLTHFIELFILSAPWLLLGLLIAGVIKVYVPTAALTRHLGGASFTTTFKAALVGAPLPLCSCGVIPATLGLKRSGASSNATVSFLVATPETGVDSVAVSYALLGPVMAVTRPIAAIVSAVMAGEMVRRFGQVAARRDATLQEGEHRHTTAETSCCDSDDPADRGLPGDAASCCGDVPAPVASGCAGEPPVSTPCCTSSCGGSPAAGKPPEHHVPAMRSRWRQVMDFALDEMLPDTAWWLLLGLFFAALVQTFVPSGWLAQWGDGLLAMAVMILISIPMYICATASTPIAVGLLAAGLSPGAVLVFLLAGPATNIATLGMVGREMGRATLTAYLAGVIGGALLSGLALNALLLLSGWQVNPAEITEAGEALTWVMWLSGALLALLIVRTGWRQWRRPVAGDCCAGH